MKQLFILLLILANLTTQAQEWQNIGEDDKGMTYNIKAHSPNKVWVKQSFPNDPSSKKSITLYLFNCDQKKLGEVQETLYDPDGGIEHSTGTTSDYIVQMNYVVPESMEEWILEAACAMAQEQADYDESKKQYGDLLSGTGKGNTDSPGNQGDPNGDPDASNLEGISTGSGVAGGGLSNRGVLYEPKIKDTSQKTGRVVVNVCVDKSGKVISASYTQRGSTTTDPDLRALAERSARQFRFNQAEIDKQCGTVTIDFMVQ